MADSAQEHLPDGEIGRLDIAANGRHRRAVARAVRVSRELGQKPRVAYTGEEYGFGFRAVQEFSDVARRLKGDLPDGGEAAAGRFRPGPMTVFFAGVFGATPPIRGGHHHHGGPIGSPMDIDVAYRQPLRSRDQALAAIEGDTVEFALVPFYQSGAGYDTESIALMSKMFSPFGVYQIEASDHFCLAVYEPQVLDVVHAAHPGSGLTYLLRRQRRTWDGAPDHGVSVTSTDMGGSSTDRTGPDAVQYQAGLNVDRASQMMLRDRVDTIFAGPEATRRCKSQLDGFRAAGVKVDETAEWVEPHREMSRRVRESLDGSRQTVHSLDPLTGQMRINSIGLSNAQSRPLYGIVLPFEVASRSPEFTIIDDNLEDAVPPKKRFLVCQKIYDVSLFEDVYRLTPLRVAYWMTRLHALKDFARDRLEHARTPGVRILMQFGRLGPVMPIGDIETFLRRFGVRYSTFQMGDNTMDTPRPKEMRGSSSGPSPIVLDVEFDLHHFVERFDDGMITRTIAEGFLYRAFNRKRHQTARLLAAFPYENAQLLPQPPHRWWYEEPRSAVITWAEELEAMFGPILGGAISFLPKSAVIAMTEFFNVLAFIFRPGVRGPMISVAIIFALGVAYWNKPVGEIFESWRSALDFLTSKFGGGK